MLKLAIEKLHDRDFIVQMLIAIAVFATVLTFAMPFSYTAGWLAYDRWPLLLKAQTPVAEVLMGLAWGAVLVAI